MTKNAQPAPIVEFRSSSPTSTYAVVTFRPSAVAHYRMRGTYVEGEAEITTSACTRRDLAVGSFYAQRAFNRAQG